MFRHFCGVCSEAAVVGMGTKRPHTWFIMEFGKYGKIMKKPISSCYVCPVKSSEL